MRILLLILKMLCIATGMCIALMVSTFTMSYIVCGFSKDAYMQLMNKIPAENFGYIIIPMFIMSFVVGVFLFKKLFDVGLSNYKKIH